LVAPFVAGKLSKRRRTPVPERSAGKGVPTHQREKQVSRERRRRGTMRWKMSVAAGLVLILAGALGGLYAGGVFGGGGSSHAAVAASQGDALSATSSSQDNTSPSDQSVYLGVQITQTADGPTIASVIADSPADKAGLQRGDVIKAIDGTSVSDVQAIRDALNGKNAGDTVTVSITRNGNAQDVTVTLEAPPTPLTQANPLLPELNGIPRDELFSHLMGGSFQFTDQKGKTHTASVDLGTVSSVDANAKAINVDLNSGGSKKYTISGDVVAVPSDLSQYASGDNVAIISLDGNLRAVVKGLGLGVPFFDGMHGFGFGGRHGLGSEGWDGSKGGGNFEMPRGGGLGGF
jgi:membrane-associated protease RseP (regulator of RpoE activity)